MSEAPDGIEIAAPGAYLTTAAPDNAIPDGQ